MRRLQDILAAQFMISMVTEPLRLFIEMKNGFILSMERPGA